MDRRAACTDANPGVAVFRFSRVRGAATLTHKPDLEIQTDVRAILALRADYRLRVQGRGMDTTQKSGRKTAYKVPA